MLNFASIYLQPCRGCVLRLKANAVTVIGKTGKSLRLVGQPRQFHCITGAWPVSPNSPYLDAGSLRKRNTKSEPKEDCDIYENNSKETVRQPGKPHIYSGAQRDETESTADTGTVSKSTKPMSVSFSIRPIKNHVENENIVTSVDNRSSTNACRDSTIRTDGTSSQKPPRTSSKKQQTKFKQQHDVAWVRPNGLNTGIQLYNSLTRQKEPLVLPNGRTLSWYTCGPTVYDHAHIGHASSYVRTDIIRRIMINLFNIDVVMVMGITDIDDKIINRSKELKMDFRRMGRMFEDDFVRDMESLKVLPPTVKTRVTEHVPHIIRFIQRLLDNGYGYRTPSGSIYFDVHAYNRYGRLWTHSMDTEIRDPADKEKKSARDFALWKAAKPDEPVWDSPWGPGRPGWHIECSTMASAVFGEQLDIHSGGDDLKFPHHENEMAQSEACFCTDQWTNYWLHTGYLHLKNEESKMSKSLKNTIKVSDLLEQYTANQFRLFCMLRPYRQLVEYSEESMKKAVNIHNHWAAFLNTADAYIHGHVACEPIKEAFLMECLQETKLKVEKALADDFDTPRAIQAMEELVHRANVELGAKTKHEVSQVRSPGVIAAVVSYVNRIMECWGIQVSNKKKLTATQVEQQFSGVMDSVVKFRSQVRKYALNTEQNCTPDDGDSNLSAKDRKRQAMKRVEPLLDACDEIRNDLKLSGLSITDHGKESFWDVLEQRKLPSKK